MTTRMIAWVNSWVRDWVRKWENTRYGETENGETKKANSYVSVGMSEDEKAIRLATKRG